MSSIVRLASMVASSGAAAPTTGRIRTINGRKAPHARPASPSRPDTASPPRHPRAPQVAAVTDGARPGRDRRIGPGRAHGDRARHAATPSRPLTAAAPDRCPEHPVRAPDVTRRTTRRKRRLPRSGSGGRRGDAPPVHVHGHPASCDSVPGHDAPAGPTITAGGAVMRADHAQPAPGHPHRVVRRSLPGAGRYRRNHEPRAGPPARERPEPEPRQRTAAKRHRPPGVRQARRPASWEPCRR